MIRSRVVTRSFYEDAYIGFFLRYYLDLGFDEIIILKSDADIFGGPCVPQYAIDNGLITQEELDSGRIKIKAVKNMANLILTEHYSEFTNQGADWVLNIDLDEFLVIDIVEYAGGINEYLERTIQSLYDNGRIGDPSYLQQIKFRWLCINKMDTQFNPASTPIINDLPLYISNCANNSSNNSANISPDNSIDNSADTSYDNSADTSYDNSADNIMESNHNVEGLTMGDYVSRNKLEMFTLLKSIGAIEHFEKPETQDCHFFNLKTMHIKNSQNAGEPYKRPNYILLDDRFIRINKYRSLYPAMPDKCMRQGFILHLNTRSLANALTKCLVTQLPNDKKLGSPDEFKTWINQLNIYEIQHLPTDFKINSISIDEIKDKFMSYLNNKQYFPKIISKFHKLYKNRLDLPATVAMLDRLISHLPLKTQHAMVGDVKTEWMQLQQLCKKRGINYSNLKAILELF